MSAWLAEQVAPCGRAVAVDLDLSLVNADVPAWSFTKPTSWPGPWRREVLTL